ncbi:hypothetical protein Ahy_B06g085638 [Arachis hypogaea]|uniref:Uncharacterized protein n=1 Tax=Arachis hypogaea TaxID=3818 RepID=A0A444YV59_ARAHY|nr:hypothetical protein Ahy_B06g085638 [Arachis hypogaea]
MAIDDWMKLAMADDSVVADLLVKIKHSEGKSLLTLPTPVLPSWGARKRRSKLEAASRAAILAAAAAANSSRKKDEGERRGRRNRIHVFFSPLSVVTSAATDVSV